MSIKKRISLTHGHTHVIATTQHNKMKHGLNPLKAKLNSVDASATAKVFVGYKKGAPAIASWKVQEVHDEIRRWKKRGDVKVGDVDVLELLVPEPERYSYKKMNLTDFVAKYKV